ncbi:MAG: hypothetical protein IPM34_06665 [Saprospiraceae bacterium]|nr:hypothetical protein [Saprospiraceae bacterium]
MRKIITLFVFVLIETTCIQIIYAQSWEKFSGPVGASIETSVITRDKGEIYCFTATGKMFFSTDRGKSWSRIEMGLPAGFAGTYTILKESPIGEVFLCHTKELYRWEPVAKMWTKITSSLDEIEDFNFSPDGRSIYYGSKNYFYVFNMATGTSNRQSWWTHSVEFLCLGNNQNFVRRTLGASGEIYKFNDDGSNLQKISNSRCCRNLFYHQTSNTLFDYDGELFVSNDFGNTWTKRTLASGIYIDKIIALKDNTLLGFGSSVVYRSNDGGITWTNDLNYKIVGYINIDYRTRLSKSYDDAILFDNDGLSTYLNAMSEIYSIELPLVEPQISSVQQVGQRNILSNNVYNYQFSSDGGQQWQKINLNRNYELYLWEDGTMMYATPDSLYFSHDLFETTYSKPYPGGSSIKLFKNVQGHLIQIAYDKSYISYDKGDNWMIVGDLVEFPRGFDLFLSRQNILCTSQYPDTMYYSLDYGLSWNKFLAKGIDDIYGITLTQNNVFWWYARDENFDYHQMYSTDFGATTQKFLPADNENVLYIDEFENIYTQSGGNTSSVKVTNILTNEIRYINLSGIQWTNSSRIKLHRGDNDTLYGWVNHSPLYKYTGKFDEANSLISGNILTDDIQNCIRDSFENKSGNFQLALKGNNRSILIPVNPLGEFKSYVTAGTYDMQLQSPSLIWSPCNFPQQINIQPNQTNDYRDLMVQPLEQCADLFSSLVMGRLRRCFDNNWATLKIRNEGSIAAQNASVTVLLDQYFENIQATHNPTSVTGNEWVFNLPEIKPGKSFTIHFQFKISCNASLGEEHCIRYWLDNPQECNLFLPIRDSIRVCDENIGSFDPNDKTAFVAGSSSDYFFSTDTSLQYLIRFQNTGTDTAFNIRIEDKLDFSLDWSSFLPMDASHAYTYKLDASGKLEFFFNDIHLPDSNLSEQNSHGYILYSIKPKPGLHAGSLIQNTAGIYFDYNDPVLTNVALLRLKQLTGNKESNAIAHRVFVSVPNPASNYTDIFIPDDWQYKKLTGSLFSPEGRFIQLYSWKEKLLRIERQHFSPGLYYLLLRDERGNTAYAKIMFE